MRSVRYYILFVFYFAKTVTFYKLYNLIKLRYTFIVSTKLKKHIFSALPAYISVEPTNTCNLQCPECPTGNKTSTVAKGFIELKTVQAVIDEARKSLLYTNIYFQGEPFLHPEIHTIISTIHTANVFTSTSTNAHYITKDNAKDVVRSGLSHIIVSLDGYDQESYEQYRRKGSFSKVIEAIDALVQAKKDLKSHTPLIELQSIVFKHTQNHLKTIKKLAYSHGVDRVVFKTPQFYSTENIAMMPDTKYSRYTIDGDKLTMQRRIKNSCWRMWSSCVVSWQGNIIPCCFDKNLTFSYGSLSQKPFKEIWKSSQAIAFKKKVHSHRRSIDMCKNCTS